ncbi:MAG: glycoside hydrolase family 32 protein, partial [bacterium]|nr:glycoside hydrolase family 32 protein [bacterium]
MEFTSKALQKARTYETEKQKEIPLAERPDFHVTPPVGWINDPNGFSCYQGEYHLFCQYHPYDTHWGPMHWMHKKSQDLITWETLPAALAPDEPYDAQGCFSGTAIEDEGQHVLLYTGVQECVQADGSLKTFQTQNIAIGDGLNYQKLPQNPVIRADLLPEGSSVSDFRDPKIWKEQGRYYAAVGNLAADGSGQIALFSAERLDAWKFETILDSCKHRYGRMWECPDFFPLDGKQVLLVSPQFMKAEGLEFHSGNNAIYLIGDYRPENFQFSRKEAYSVDYGLDFYAPQTVEAFDGRRILIGWLQSWDNYLTPPSQAWSGIMSIPRELSIRDGRLIQTPVRELSAYHGKSVQKQNILLQGGSYLPCRDATSYQEESGEMSQILGIQG